MNNNKYFFSLSKQDSFGLDKIEVTDNGIGVKEVNVPYMVKQHCTSKLVKTEDLASLETYGFRGEALGKLKFMLSLFQE